MVGSTYPPGGEARKGLAVRQLKCYASWVQTVLQRIKFASGQSESYRDQIYFIYLRRLLFAECTVITINLRRSFVVHRRQS